MKKRCYALAEVGKTHLRLAVVEETEKGKLLTKLIQKDLSEKKSLPEIIAAENISFDELILVLSRDQVVLRNLELPTTHSREIEDILKIQAGKQTPFSKEDIVYDFKILGSRRENYSQVLLGIIQKSVLKTSLDLFPKEAVQKVVLGSECLAGWACLLRARGQDKTFSILSFDEDLCEWSVFSEGQLLFSRILPFKRHDLTRGRWQNRFRAEFERSINAYQEENAGPGFNKVFVMGEEAFGDELKKILAPQFSLEQIHPFDSLQGIAFSKEAEAVLKGPAGISFAALVGLALNPGKDLMNLLPPEVKQKRFVKVQRKKQIQIGALSLLVIVLGIGIFIEQIATRTWTLQKFDTQLTQLSQRTEKLQKENQKIQLMRDQLDSSDSAVVVLREIHRLAPPQISLSVMIFEEDKRVSLRGTSTEISEVFRWVNRLEELPIFEGVETKQVQKKKKFKDQEVTEFEIVAPLV